MTVVAIHQPTYLPWLGLFHKIRKCDVFVLLDDVQFPKQGGNWINRCKINAGGDPRWMTIPVLRPSGFQMIADVVAADTGWPEAHMRLVDLHYRGAPEYSEQREMLMSVLGETTASLLEFNVSALTKILDILHPGEKNKIVRASALGTTSTGTQRLVELVRRAGGSVYLSGDGSDGYLDPLEFERQGVTLTYQGFVEAPRPQLGATEFIPGLSVVDALMMIGAPAVSRLLDLAQSGRD